MAGDPTAGQKARAATAIRSPFLRLTELLGDAKPGRSPINLSVGEPRHPVPSFVGPVLAQHIKGFGKYPMLRGTERFRRAASAWLGRRYALPRAIDPERELLVLNGSREGLFLAALAARRLLGDRGGRPAMVVPNPFYPAYAAGAEAAGCEVIALAAGRERDFLPDYDALPDETLDRAVAIYLCSPSNPQGAVLSREALARIAARARKHGALVFADECYSEIWLNDSPPPGILESAGGSFDNVVAFHSLSKRSNLPGLRCGFAAGDAKFITAFSELRNVSAPQVAEPLQEVGIAAYSDEYHVEETRALYREKFDLADGMLAGRFGHRRPEGGFFLWLDVTEIGDDETATKRLWTEAGLRVVPGSYLARSTAGGSNPGAGFIRVALVDDINLTREALERFASFKP